MEQKTNPEFRQSGILYIRHPFRARMVSAISEKALMILSTFCRPGTDALAVSAPRSDRLRRFALSVFLRLCRPASDHQPGKAHGLRAADGGRCRLPSGME